MKKSMSNKQLREKMVRKDKGGKVVHISWLKQLTKYISFLIVKILKSTKITPIQVSAFNLFILFLSLITLSIGTRVFLNLSIILFFLIAILDTVDGDLARLKNLKSRYGGWLDNLSAIFIEFVWILGIAIGLYNQIVYSNPQFLFIYSIGPNLVLILGVVAILELFLFSTSGAAFQIYLQHRGLIKAKEELEGHKRNIYYKRIFNFRISDIVSKTNRFTFLILCILFNQLFLALVFYGIIFFVFIVLQFRYQKKVLLKAGYYR